MLVNSDKFWAEDRAAPLMSRNCGFLVQGQTDAIVARVAKWPEIVGISTPVAEPASWPDPKTMNEADQRIVQRDAERTFLGTTQRQLFTKVLAAAITEFKDYQQSLGYVAGFLLLTQDAPTTLALLRIINSDPRYLVGYWHHEAIGAATDAYVFEHLLSQRQPEIYAHLKAAGIWPDTYVQKWFAGLAIHVLTFEALFDFVEEFLRQGYHYLFKFALALVDELKDDILKIPASQSPALYDLLRLDPKVSIVSPELCARIVKKAQSVELEGVDVPALRKQMFEEKLRKRLEDAKAFAEKAKKQEAESDDSDSDDSDSDGGGVVCQLCDDMMPELYCKDCGKAICENCHKKQKQGHLKTHKVTRDEDELAAVIEKLGSLAV